VALTVERVGGERLPARARELHAAEFVHTTARGVSGALPDPQLHSHVVVTSLERQDGTIAAVRSRPAFRAAAEVGAFYRAQLATGMRALGFTTEQAGKDRRYFRIRGVDDKLERAFSKRTEEVHHAWADFRARHGRDPQRGELRTLAVRTRTSKLPQTRDELDSAWRREASSNGLDRARLAALRSPTSAPPDPEAWADHVEVEATRTRPVAPQSMD
jgi:conjugative relaxase-like TrwC/TraI family protein